jgi:hypothetical protein
MGKRFILPIIGSIKFILWNGSNHIPKINTFITRPWDKVKCTTECTELQYHLWKKPNKDKNWYELFPKYLPPLNIICADGDSDYFLVVLSSENLIKESLSRIDVFNREGRFLGFVKTPISMNQWVVFAPEFYFKDSVVLKNNLIYIHIDEHVEVYQINR